MKVLNDSADVLNYESMGFTVRASVEIAAPGQATHTLKPKLLQRPEVLNGDTTTKIIFAEEKSQLTLVERMRKLGEESVAGLVRV